MKPAVSSMTVDGGAFLSAITQPTGLLKSHQLPDGKLESPQSLIDLPHGAFGKLVREHIDPFWGAKDVAPEEWDDLIEALIESDNALDDPPLCRFEPRRYLECIARTKMISAKAEEGKLIVARVLDEVAGHANVDWEDGRAPTDEDDDENVPDTPDEAQSLGPDAKASEAPTPPRCDAADQRRAAPARHTPSSR